MSQRVPNGTDPYQNDMKRFIWISILILITLNLIWIWGGFAAQTEQTFSANLVGEVTVPDGFARADGSHTWDFPADHGPHPDYQTEWWYYTGNLETADGHKFGYQLTFFRRGLTPAAEIAERESNWSGDQIYMGHFALSDISGEAHYDFERFSRGGAELAGAQAEPFQVWLEDWEVVEIGNGELGIANGEWRMRAAQDGIELDLVFEDEKGIVFQGIDGYSQKGTEAWNASYYFSQPRLASTGTVTIKGEEFQVSGLSWMDHEFSTSALSAGQIGWDWFSLQLSDNSDLMVFQIRRADGSIDPFSSGTVIQPDGQTIHLDRDSFEIQVTDTWRSATSDATYPAAWMIQIPHHDQYLRQKGG